MQWEYWIYFFRIEMTQQLHYTIDSFEINYEASTGTALESNVFANKHRQNIIAGHKHTASNVTYDTICFELPTYFTQSKNPDKSIEIQYIHLLQRPNGTQTTITENEDGSSTTTTETMTPSIAADGSPILTTIRTVTETDTAGQTTTQTTQFISNNNEWNALASTLHSDLVQFRPSADSYVMSTNIMYNWQKKFIIPDSRASFDIWFRDLNGFIIEMDPVKTRIIIELLLTF